LEPEATTDRVKLPPEGTEVDARGWVVMTGIVMGAPLLDELELEELEEELLEEELEELLDEELEDELLEEEELPEEESVTTAMLLVTAPAELETTTV
jgi:hypothetical protein